MASNEPVAELEPQFRACLVNHWPSQIISAATTTIAR
jgi:hypothetical protein